MGNSHSAKCWVAITQFEDEAWRVLAEANGRPQKTDKPNGLCRVLWTGHIDLGSPVGDLLNQIQATATKRFGGRESRVASRESRSSPALLKALIGRRG